MTTILAPVDSLVPAKPPRSRGVRGALALTGVLMAAALPLHAADVTVQPAAGSGFVVKDATGANERLRVQESGTISMPAVVGASTQAQGVCIGAGGQLGPCTGGGSGGNYAAGTGLNLNGTLFSVAPTYQLPQQNCAAGQYVQWTGSGWTCSGASGSGGALPPGSVNQTLRYSGTNTVVANNLLQAFSDGGLLATGAIGTGAIPATGTGTRVMWYPAKAAFRAGGVNTPAWDDANVGAYSVAIGQNPTAKGSISISMGVGTAANGAASVALGDRTIADGNDSTALGNSTHTYGANSMALGSNATAYGTGSFVFGDGSAPIDDGLQTSGNFVVLAHGGATFFTSKDCAAPGSSCGVTLVPGTGTWSSLSDRNSKTAVRPVDIRDVLEKVVALPLNTWQYKTQEAKYRHMGPMAQDFYAAFGLGESDTRITTIDADGVALAAIQGLHALLVEKDAEAAARLDEKDREIAALHAELVAQQRKVASFESLAGELADMKEQLAALRKSSAAAMSVALRQP